MAQMIKNLPAMWETQVQSLGKDSPLEEGMATHSSILVCRIPWTEEPGRATVHVIERLTLTYKTLKNPCLWGLSPCSFK